MLPVDHNGGVPGETRDGHSSRTVRFGIGVLTMVGVRLGTTEGVGVEVAVCFDIVGDGSGIVVESDVASGVCVVAEATTMTEDPDGIVPESLSDVEQPVKQVIIRIKKHL